MWNETQVRKNGKGEGGEQKKKVQKAHMKIFKFMKQAPLVVEYKP